MKIIQILDELSNKNISLVSVAKIISNYDFLSKKSKIITSKNKTNFGNIKIFKNNIKNFLFFSPVYYFLYKHKPDIIHIHGLWRPIHLLFILKSLVLNIPVIIQPHGMLLDQALRSKSRINYIFKVIILRLYRLLLHKKVSFIAVTLEEKKSITKFFLNSKIFIIQNPFKTTDEKINQIKKLFVYFGRYNSHKNLKEFIEAFIKAKLGDEWFFSIYGIDDDNNYKKELINLVKKNNYEKKIKFLPPEYNIKKKNRILNEAWCNVLISQSEVLSLSVLEALSLGTKSLINKKIFFPKWIKQNSYTSSINQSDLIKKINFIKNQNLNKQKEEKKELKKIFKKKYVFQKLENNYQICLKKTFNNQNNKKNYSVYVSFFSNILNSFLTPYLIILSVLFSNNSLATEIGLVPGIIALINQVFSANSRSLLIYNQQLNFFNQVISFRIIFGLANFFFIILGAYIIGFKQNFYLLLFISISVYLSWVIEIIISFNEKNRIVNAMKIFALINAIFYLIIFFNFIIISNTKLTYIFLIFIIFQLLFIFYFLPKKVFEINEVYLAFAKFIKTSLAFFSSFFNILPVMIWRLSLLFILGKETAGIFYASFAIASFPGTLFNNIIGQTLIVNNYFVLLLKKKAKLIFATYFIVLFLFFLSFRIIFEKETAIFFQYTLISLIGTPILLIALFYRHSDLSKGKKIQNIIFIKDFFYGIFISPIIFITFYLGGENYVVYSFILSSIIAYVIFSPFFKINK
jgi:glycosyltransferase involved in cell wall biosynthesis